MLPSTLEINLSHALTCLDIRNSHNELREIRDILEIRLMERGKRSQSFATRPGYMAGEQYSRWGRIQEYINPSAKF